MEEPMSKLRLLGVLAIAVTAVVIGLLTAGSVPSLKTNGTAGIAADVTPRVASDRPAAPEAIPTDVAPRDIVPSLVIDTNPVFFFGAGDGSNGYYAERPKK
jgi:hypothetical protein